jgi:anti-sigma factor RsiW
MDNERIYDLERLNALVDGELAPTERAEIAARLAVERDLASAYATLARLKATTAETAKDCPTIFLRQPRRVTVRRHAAAVAACIALVVGGVLLVQAWFREEIRITGTAEGPTEITLASLPAGTMIPRLDTAGLKLINLAFHPGSVPLLTATYRGPHGCRLDLRAWPVGADAPPAFGSSLHRWGVGALVYELTAHGMPDWRFRVIADSAEQQTRTGADPARIDRRLRLASRGAAPCLG